MKLLPEMYLWTSKNWLNFGSSGNLDPDQLRRGGGLRSLSARVSLRFVFVCVCVVVVAILPVTPACASVICGINAHWLIDCVTERVSTLRRWLRAVTWLTAISRCSLATTGRCIATQPTSHSPSSSSHTELILSSAKFNLYTIYTRTCRVVSLTTTRQNEVSLHYNALDATDMSTRTSSLTNSWWCQKLNFQNTVLTSFILLNLYSQIVTMTCMRSMRRAQ